MPTPNKRAEAVLLIAQATALLPFVSEERRARLMALVARLKAGTHGIKVGASFGAKVHRA